MRLFRSQAAPRGRRDTAARERRRRARRAVERWRRSRTRLWIVYFTFVIAIWTAFLSPALAQMGGDAGSSSSSEFTSPDGSTTTTSSDSNSTGDMAPLSIPGLPPGGPDDWTRPGGLVSTLKVMLVLTVLTLAPAIMLMTTSFVRIVVVLGLLRQAIGTQQLPPSQVITSLALFVTLLIMLPVWQEVYDHAIVPYTNEEIGLQEAWERGEQPIRMFMAMQIERTGNAEDVLLFMRYIPDAEAPETYADVPWRALLPAFMLSELKTAFLIGFQIYLPFLILDMVIASVMVSMGMLMLPPVLISLPFKLMLFILLDGWRLVIGMLLESFSIYGSG